MTRATAAAALLVVLLCASPARADLLADVLLPDSAAEAARRGAAFAALAAHARSDPDARRGAADLLEARAWAHAALGGLLSGEAWETAVARPAGPAGPAAFRDLAYLASGLPGLESAALRALEEGRRAFDLGEDLALEAEIRRAAGLPAGAPEGILGRLVAANARRARAVREARLDRPAAVGPPADPGPVLGDLFEPLEREALGRARAGFGARPAGPLEPFAVDPPRPSPGGAVRIGVHGLASVPAGLEALVLLRAGRMEETIPAAAGPEPGCLAVRLPARLPPGPADLRVAAGGETSVPLGIVLSPWPPARAGEPLPSSRWRLAGYDAPDSLTDRPGDRVVLAAPGLPLVVDLGDEVDSAVLLLEEAGGRWRAVPPAAVHAATAGRFVWKVPDLPPGLHRVAWAGRTGGAWGLPATAVAPWRLLSVEGRPRAPRIDRARYHHEVGPAAPHAAAPRIAAPHARRPGDLVVESPDLVAGEIYRLLWSGGGREVVCETDGVLVRDVGAVAPETVSVAAVSAAGAGAWAEPVRVQVIGAPPAPPPPPAAGTRAAEEIGLPPLEARPPGVAAVEWTVPLAAALERWRAREGRNPTEFEILFALRLEGVVRGETWPRSPWGGPWSYHPEPGGRTATLLARDTDGRLAAQWHDGEIENGLVVYEEVAGGEALARLPADLLWVPPWRGGSLGAFAAEAVRAAARADVALVPASTLRGNLPAGPVTEGHLRHAIPRDEEIVILSLRGLDLRAALIRGGEEDRWRLHASGAGPRDENLRWSIPTFEIVLDDGSPLDDAATYAVAVPSSLSLGADGHLAFLHALDRRPAGVTLRGAVASALHALP